MSECVCVCVCEKRERKRGGVCEGEGGSKYVKECMGWRGRE